MPRAPGDLSLIFLVVELAHPSMNTVDELIAMLNSDSKLPEKWKERDRVGNVYNRAVFYHSGMLHSATRHFGSNLRYGRIYQAFRFGVQLSHPKTSPRL